MNAKANRKPPKSLRILFADDEAPLQELMRTELPRMGHQVVVCADGDEAVAALSEQRFDCLIVDLDMPGRHGLEVIEAAKAVDSEVEAVVLTGKSSLESAIGALRQGAFDYLTKPCRLVELKGLLQRVAEKRELTNQVRAARRQLERVVGKSQLIGQSEGIERVRQLITKVAPTHSTVLVLGETGTGKELVARAVHDQSRRADKPFVAVNCGALPETLIESELFGHRRGAFTGANENRTGLFEVADGGTIFLDEIGELPKSMQAKLLRVLESGEIRRVGDNESFQVDVRIVCATHRDLDRMVQDGDFREDLMFRINTFEIELPPLRVRSSDIPLLAEHFFRRFRPGLPENETIFTGEALEALKHYSWPGNVRELANVVEHAAILSDDPPVGRDDLPRHFDSRRSRPKGLGPMTLRELEQIAIHESLERHEGSKAKAAAELGISLKTLYNKLNQSAALEKSA